MIKQIYNEDSTNEEDLSNFINKENVQNTLNRLNSCDEEYIITMDIASKDSKDNSCIMYYTKDDDGNWILQATAII